MSERRPTYGDLPWHPFLIVLYFILSKINSYYGLLGAAIIVEYLCYYLLVAVFVVLLSRVIFRWRTANAYVWSSMLLTAFFFFGATFDFMESIPFLSGMARYKYVLPFTVGAVGVLTYFLINSPKNFVRLNGFMNLFMGILVLMQSVLLITNSVKIMKDDARMFRASPFETVSLQGVSSKPDIFFIVFDEYASSLSLRHHYGFDNATTDSLLIENGFFLNHTSKSNYNYTPLSIASSFNGSYSQLDPEGDTATSHDWLKAWKSVEESALVKLLHTKPYKLHNYSISNLPSSEVHTYTMYEETKRSALFDETLLGRVSKDIGWLAIKYHVPLLGKLYKSETDKRLNRYLERNESNFQNLVHQLSSEGGAPRFVYAHFLVPHPPYLLDSAGNKKLPPDYSESNLAGYLEQVQYSNKMIQKIAHAIPDSPARELVVIIQGDHGYRYNDQPENRDRQFMNLNAVYFSNANYSALYDGMSPVNTFRAVFNTYFETKLPMLKDSTILFR